MESKIYNAVIERTSLGREDYGILSSMIHLELDGGGVGFGGYCLKGTAAADWLEQVLDTLEVDAWEKLPGQRIRIDCEGWGGRCLAIGHFMKEKWFNPKEFWNK